MGTTNGTTSMQYDFSGIAVKELLDHDPRPTFVLDLDPDNLSTTSTSVSLKPLFCNEALRSHDQLLDILLGEIDRDLWPTAPSDRDSSAFRSWATSVTKFDDSRDVYPLTFVLHGMLWTGMTIRRRWRIISGNQYSQSPDTSCLDLSAGPPKEVATGGYALEQGYRNGLGLTVPMNGSHTITAKRDHREDTSGTTLATGQQQHHSPIQSKVSKHSFSQGTSGTGNTRETTTLSLSTPEEGIADWTASKFRGPKTPYVSFFRNIDWTSTPLVSDASTCGTSSASHPTSSTLTIPQKAMKSWSRELRQLVNVVMNNPHPAALFWGNEMTVVYNEAYANEVAGNKHPTLMGTGFAGPFAEVWESLRPVFTECARTGNSIRRENDALYIDRHSYLEETFFSWSFTPVYGGTPRILGFYNAPFETTAHCIGQRRMQTLQKLATSVTGAKTVKEFWQRVLDGVADNHFDVPFALLYSVTDSEDGEGSSVASGSAISMKSCVFEGAIAVPAGHPAAANRLDLKRSREGFIPSFREAMRTREPTKLQTRDGTLPEVLLDGIEWRGFGDPCKEAIIFPIRPTNGESVLAFLLLGVNPRRAYDDEYQAFTTLLNRQLASALASVLLFEEETRLGLLAIENAAKEQETLNEQLAVQTTRLQRLTSLSSLGMFYISGEGVILEGNDRYYEMTSQDRQDLTEMCFMDQLVESSKPVMTEGWTRMTVDLLPWSAELQLNKQWIDPANPKAEPIEYWVLANSQPELTADGKLRSVMGSITDISRLKWAQGLQDRRLREVEETRRQQNEFIDITSHEMRNPLSAILQCADDIVSTMKECQPKLNGTFASSIENCIDSASTISLCVQHQKSIVDDILTVSKLDSNLLVLTPATVKPVQALKQTLKMFDSEMLAKRITFNLVVDESVMENKVDWIKMDSGRVSQVVINLMTNAIKFVGERPRREITVSVGASPLAPIPRTSDFEYIPRRNTDTILGEEWKGGEPVYIRIKVQDTGCGLTTEEKQLLFQRFKQASPRTHAQYGGSGLGLFISRRLTEMHGGQIGVASQAGVGSTFGFFIRGTRANPPTASSMSATQSVNHALQASAQAQVPDNALYSSPKAAAGLVRRASSVDGNHSAESDDDKLHVLVVEDNLVNQKVLVRQLVKVGCEVTAADNGQIALDCLEKTEYRQPGGAKLSVVLMDLEMPVMDGLTCVRRIREMQKQGQITTHLPVMAVTANVRQEQVLAAMESGMDDVVSKPFRVPDLLAKIEVLLKRLNKAP